MTITTETYVLDPDSYVKHGAFNDDSPAWGDTVRALGGKDCSIFPSWRVGLPVGDVLMTVTGTPEAVAFVDATLAV